MVVCDDLWWFVVICGGLWSFAMVCGGLSYSRTVIFVTSGSIAIVGGFRA